MRIKVRLSEKSIKEAQAAIKQYKAKLTERLTEFVKRLAQEGVEVAKIRFDAAAYDGQKDVSVTFDTDGTKARVIASGKTVLFLEFGAGTTYPDHPSGLYEHGTYGKGFGNAQKYPHGWIYKGEKGTGGQEVLDKNGNVRPGIYRTQGNPPAEAMWAATTKIAEAVPRIWREVMSE